MQHCVDDISPENRGEGFPTRDISSLHTTLQGFYQMGRVLWTSPPPSPSIGFTGGLSPPDPPPCLSSKVAGHQNAWYHTRMLGTSVFPDSQVIPEWLVLQYFQKSRLYQNGRSFSISRYTSYTKMVGPSVFPDSRVKKSSPKRLLNIF